MSIASTHATAQFLFPKLPYDPFRDFLPVTQLALSPVALLVNASQPWKTMRDVVEAASIRAQARLYRGLPALRQMVPDDADLALVEPFLAPLVTLDGFDLGQGRLTSFSAFRFLYERLIGAEARPWLPSAFCAAAALPHLHPELRRKLLQSISEAAATASGWSNRQPAFFPHWVEKVDNGSAALPH